MFVDTSTIVAIVCGESDATELAQRPRSRGASIHLAARASGSVYGACVKTRYTPSQANALFDDFLDDANLSIVAIDDRIGSPAVACFEAFGKGRHPARLNLGDCLSYACVKADHSPLLFKGNDFSQTQTLAATSKCQSPATRAGAETAHNPAALVRLTLKRSRLRW
ncbi:type II toxin-antitoxin system VapC family toxin [Methylocystis sp. Sn-Cys]|uniref:type II toxin-antitoxin system VapC family toxin n=1 Tax=Methylocystis sp. Sn-Cys TaxID=1701263 RepID=UPI001924753E|nr:type II toxin-antitoxin system VapC family toxin [Methylocystis sp. Sn-Cys]